MLLGNWVIQKPMLGTPFSFKLGFLKLFLQVSDSEYFGLCSYSPWVLLLKGQGSQNVDKHEKSMFQWGISPAGGWSDLVSRLWFADCWKLWRTQETVILKAVNSIEWIRTVRMVTAQECIYRTHTLLSPSRRDLNVLSHIFLKIISWTKWSCLHFTDEETDPRKIMVTSENHCDNNQ